MSAVPDNVTPFPAVDRASYYAAQRAYTIGSALVEPSDSAWGKDSSEFSPEEYAHYAARSIAVYAATRIRAQNLAKLPVKLWKRKRNGDLQEVERGRPGSLYELLDRVNPFWTFKRLIRMTELARCLQGQAFWVLDAWAQGRPTELWWVRPDHVRVHPHPRDYIAGYTIDRAGQRIAFGPREVLHFPLDNPIDEWSGLSPLASARLSVDVALDAMYANRNIHRNGSRISGIVGPEAADRPLTAPQIKQLQDYINTELRGVDNVAKLAISAGAVKFMPWTMSPKDAEFLGQLKWSLGDVGRAYGIPPELLGDHEHATYSNIEQAYKGLWSDTLIPEADDLADVLTEFLVPLFPGEADVVTLDYSQVPALQEDRTETSAQATVWIDRGVPLNAALQEFAPNLLPPNGTYAWGDVPIWEAKAATQAALAEATTTVDDDAAQMSGSFKGQTDAVAAEGADDPARGALALIRTLRTREADWAYGGERHTLALRRFDRAATRHERQIRRVVVDLFERQQESVLARLRRRGMTGAYTRDDDDAVDAPFDLAEWVRRFVQAMLPALEDVLADGAAEVLDQLGLTADFDVTNPRVAEWLRARAQRFAQAVNETTWNALRDSLAVGLDAGESIEELAERVQAVFTDATERRAEVIARTEGVGALNAGGLEAARQSGVVSGKTWLSALDERVRETHVAAHGQTVLLDADFQVGAGSGPAPGQLGVAEEDIQCRCTLTWVLAD